MKLLSLCTLFVLGACGTNATAPTYQNTSYILPASPGGRMCVDQCKKARDYCSESCSLDYRACYNDMQSTAQNEYDHYVRDRFINNTPTELLPSDFEHPEKCNSEKKHCLADCGKPYNACYTTCGGSVSTTSSCQFLCFE
jgi:hypothetical protein